MDTLKYKEYEGTAEIDMDRFVCRGKILFINDLIVYEAASPSELQHAFEAAVEDYVETCAELGIEPKKPLKGQFSVRVKPDLHKACALRALKDGVSLNETVERALEAFVNFKAEVINNYNFTISTHQVDLVATSVLSTDTVSIWKTLSTGSIARGCWDETAAN